MNIIINMTFLQRKWIQIYTCVYNVQKHDGDYGIKFLHNEWYMDMYTNETKNTQLFTS